MRYIIFAFTAFFLSGCFGPPRSVVEPEGVRIFRDITYATVDTDDEESEQQLDLYLPEQYDEPLPIVIWIHGGGWVVGDRSPCPIARLATRGYAVASISYRLSKGPKDAIYPAPLHDAKAAVRWLRKHAWQFGLDPDRIGVWGASAGGHIAALLGTANDIPELEGTLGDTSVSSRVQAVCCLFPITDLVTLDQQRDYWRINLVLSALLHGKPEEKPDLARLASPAQLVTADDAPICLIHGTADSIVPYQQSELLHEKLRTAGVESTLVLIHGMPHGNATLARPKLRDAAHEFFDKHLKPKIPANAKR